MEQRMVREEIFKILFEHEIIDNGIENRVEEFLTKNKLSKSKEDFFKNFILGYVENEQKTIEIIKEKLSGWTFERLGVVERVLLKMSFYEIEIQDEAYEIAINETIEIAKKYGDTKTKKFINGILASLVKGK